MIAAEELDMDVDQFRHIAFDTGGPTPSPNTGNTGGSTSISQGGPLVRRAAAEARRRCSAMAATNLGVPVASLTVAKGVVSGGGKTVTYGQLVGDKLFNVKFTTTTLNAGAAPGKPVANYTIVGKAAAPARRHPVDRGRLAHLRRERAHPGHVARPASSGRAARARTATARTRSP